MLIAEQRTRLELVTQQLNQEQDADLQNALVESCLSLGVDLADLQNELVFVRGSDPGTDQQGVGVRLPLTPLPSSDCVRIDLPDTAPLSSEPGPLRCEARYANRQPEKEEERSNKVS